LDWAGLSDCADLRCGQLSAGQQRRVALARLRVSDAAVCLLDEPFTALDDSGVRLVEAQLEQMAAAGQIVVLTSHTQPALRDLYSRDLQQNGLVAV
jgi:heme exporter protein A